MTPKQLEQYRDAHLNLEKQRIRKQDFLNHVLGQYMGIALNEPKNYPNQPKLSQTQENVDMSDEDMERQARRNTIRMGGKINDN